VGSLAVHGEEEVTRSAVSVTDGVTESCSLSGIELHFGWENPESAVISHFWIDPKLRNEGIGQVVLEEALSQVAQINRIYWVGVSIQAADGATKHLLAKTGFEDIRETDHPDYEKPIVKAYKNSA
jgi:GNAT superfamily N-acetyltransferase